MLDLFMGEFKLGAFSYEVLPEHYLEVPDGLSTYEEITSAVKHIAVQKRSYATGKRRDEERAPIYVANENDPFRFAGRVLIIDGNNMAHRCRHTFNLSNNGQDVSVTYGFLKVLSTTMKRFDAIKSVIVCWDGGVPKYRRDLIPDYKVRVRDEDGTYEEFKEQMNQLMSILPMFGVHSLRMPGVEADDLMHHAARLIGGDLLKIIVSSDRDLLQCIRYDTHVFQPSGDIIVTAENFNKVTGVNLAEYLVYRCLVGDDSDNVKGCIGIGEKYAKTLIETYGASPSNMLNVANGLNPEAPPMSSSISQKLTVYGLEGFTNTMSVIRLDYDRLGVRGYLLEALNRAVEFNHLHVKSYLLTNAFISLMEPEFYSLFRPLQPRPIIVSPDILNTLRMPLVAPAARYPCLNT